MYLGRLPFASTVDAYMLLGLDFHLWQMSPETINCYNFTSTSLFEKQNCLVEIPFFKQLRLLNGTGVETALDTLCTNEVKTARKEIGLSVRHDSSRHKRVVNQSSAISNCQQY